MAFFKADDSLSLLSYDELSANRPSDADMESERAIASERTYPIVEVIAPESLPQGYTFDVEVNHEILTVTVPWGGISKGQKIRMQTQAKLEDNRQRLRIPIGGWKDGLMDFFAYGPFHPSICMSLCCPLISLGQIFTRLGLNWQAKRLTDPSSHRAFQIMVAISFAYFTLLNILSNPSKESESALHYVYMLHLLFVAIIAAKTRYFIRNAYDIPATLSKTTSALCGMDENQLVPQIADNVEDFVCSCVCAPCVISQMNRHTAMYDTYDASCFSSNGMPKHAPMMV